MIHKRNMGKVNFSQNSEKKSSLSWVPFYYYLLRNFGGDLRFMIYDLRIIPQIPKKATF